MKITVFKIQIWLLFAIAVACPAFLFAQTVDDVKGVFTEYFVYASSAAMFLLIELSKKIPWVAKHLPSRLISVIVGLLAGVAMVLITGLPALSIAQAFGLLVFVYNTITGAKSLLKEA